MPSGHAAAISFEPGHHGGGGPAAACSQALQQAAAPDIREKLTARKAKTLAYDAAENLLDRYYESDDLPALAREQGFKMSTTSFFTRAQGPQGLKPRVPFAEAAFELQEMDVSDIMKFAIQE